MENLTRIEKSIQKLEYRLGVIEKLLDTNEFFNMHKGENNDIYLLRTEVLKDMKETIKDLKIDVDINQARDFYQK